MDYVRSIMQGFEPYASSDAAVTLAFEQWPTNTCYEHVLVKVVLLNRLASTNILDVHGVARHVLSLNIDPALDETDPELVPRIARYQLSNGKQRNHYSFATKYTAWHRPDDFQIYDSRVDCVLWHYQRAFRFSTFRRSDMRHYPSFLRIVHAFQQSFGLEMLSRRELDRFLWLEGGRLTNTRKPQKLD